MHLVIRKPPLIFYSDSEVNILKASSLSEPQNSGSGTKPAQDFGLNGSL
jgi:hypothetical protein